MKKRIQHPIALRALLSRLKRERARGKRIAFTNGCFDLLHVGHIQYLEKIKQQADCLVVGINSDKSIRRLKGKGRPLVGQRQRAQVLGALTSVDYVTIFNTDTPLKLIQAIRPHLLAKGGDWKISQIVGAKEVKQRRGKVVRIRYLKGHSTRQLIRKIAKSHGSSKRR